MKVLGIGLQGCTKFCDLMDMPPFLTQASYAIVKNIHTSVQTVAEKLFEKAVEEEIVETCRKKDI